MGLHGRSGTWAEERKNGNAHGRTRARGRSREDKGTGGLKLVGSRGCINRGTRTEDYTVTVLLLVVVTTDEDGISIARTILGRESQ